MTPGDLLLARRAAAALLLGGLACACVAPARAQLLNTFFPRDIIGIGVTPGVTVLSRDRPDYADPGVRVGNVVIRPQLAETFGYDDNLLGQRQGSGSAFVRTDASVQARTDWSRNALGLALATADRRFVQRPDQNETNWRGSLGGSYEIGRDVASLSYQHFSTHQDPTDIDSGGFDRPLAYDLDHARTSYQWVLPRLSLTPAFDFTRYRFGTASLRGVPVIERQRDRDEFQEELTVRYALRPETGLLAVIRPTQVHYTSAVNGVRIPNSSGVAVLAGLDYPGGGLWRYRAVAGYQTRSFATTYKTHSAPVAEADATWNPTGLTTVTGALSRTIEDAGSEDVTGYTFTRVRLSVDHEYRRNILLRGYVGLENAAYLQSNREQTRYRAGVSASWLLNRYARVVASYDFLDSTQSGLVASTAINAAGIASAGGTYTRNQYLLRIEFGRFDAFD